MDAVRKNWAGNYEFRASRVYVPQSVAEVQEIVRGASILKAAGTRHSFNGIADTTGDQISLEKLTQMSLDAMSRTVTIAAGVTYGQLSAYLHRHGFALHNLASLPHISVAGACATATHGSGSRNGNLSTAVSGMEMVTANGDILQLSREQLPSLAVHLGALGVVTKLTLNVQPAFEMRQLVYENLPFEQLEEHLEEIFASGYSVSLFTDWQNHRATQMWVKDRADAEFPDEFFGAKRATCNLHPLPGFSAEHCTEQMGIPGPGCERLPHFRMNFTPSGGDELQSEYFVPRDKGYEAILAVEELRDRITPHLFITELRTIDADDLWMSTCYQRASVGIHFTWRPEWAAVRELLPMIEGRLAPFDARPHWAKLFTMSPSHLYPKLPAFRSLCNSYDPDGKFRNEYLKSYLNL
ncbi:MAG TPA: FAD-binding protein [Bryobacteraceae bacterium]|jgi:xylitol oxidase